MLHAAQQVSIPTCVPAHTQLQHCAARTLVEGVSASHARPWAAARTCSMSARQSQSSSVSPVAPSMSCVSSRCNRVLQRLRVLRQQLPRHPGRYCSRHPLEISPTLQVRFLAKVLNHIRKLRHIPPHTMAERPTCDNLLVQQSDSGHACVPGVLQSLTGARRGARRAPAPAGAPG